MKKIFLLWLICFVNCSLFAQTVDSVVAVRKGTMYLLSGRTIGRGDYLIAGRGSRKGGYYRAIGFQNHTNLFYFLPEAPANAQHPRTDSSRLQEDGVKMRMVLNPGDSVQVKRMKTGKPVNNRKSYIAVLKTLSFPNTRLRANLDTAFAYRELMLPKRINTAKQTDQL